MNARARNFQDEIDRLSGRIIDLQSEIARMEQIVEGYQVLITALESQKEATR